MKGEAMFGKHGDYFTVAASIIVGMAHCIIPVQLYSRTLDLSETKDVAPIDAERI